MLPLLLDADPGPLDADRACPPPTPEVRVRVIDANGVTVAARRRRISAD